MASITQKEITVAVALAVLCALIYGPIGGFQFVSLDDNQYVYQNTAVASGLNFESLRWAFTSFYAANWHPLTWISHMVDVELLGLNSGAHHLVNLLFHAINGVLAYAVFRILTGDHWKSALVAVLFAVHPAHVESVAWIAERKDVLSGTFFLLTILAYVRFARTPREPQEPAGGFDIARRFLSPRYILLVLLFAAGLMAKPMLVTLPFVLLLLDFWSLRRLNKVRDLPALVLEKLPLFLLTAGSSVITFFAQRSSGAVATLDFLPFSARFSNAVVAYVKYIAMLFYPADLAVLYPREDVGLLSFVLAIVLLVAITVASILQISARRYLLFGWLWFLGTLVPVIGLVQVGGQSMADRYTYIPYFGLFVIVVWGGAEILERLRIPRQAEAALAVVVVIVFSVVAFIQVSYWRDSETLYKRALSVTQNNFLIEHNLCHEYVFSGRLDEGEVHCDNSIRTNPNYVDAQNTLAILKLKRGNYAEAERAFRDILHRWPNYVPGYVNLAVTLSIEEKPEEAESVLAQGAKFDQNAEDRALWVDPVKNLADLYAKQNKHEKALENYIRAIFLAPYRADVRRSTAASLYALGRYDEGLTQIQAAVELDAGDADTFYQGGLLFEAKGKRDDAVLMFERAIALRPDFPEARNKLEKLKGDKTK